MKSHVGVVFPTHLCQQCAQDSLSFCPRLNESPGIQKAPKSQPSKRSKWLWHVPDRLCQEVAAEAHTGQTLVGCECKEQYP